MEVSPKIIPPLLMFSLNPPIYGHTGQTHRYPLLLSQFGTLMSRLAYAPVSPPPPTPLAAGTLNIEKVM